MLQVSATWVKDTDLLGRPRSPQLKMLDAAIEGYRRAPNWPNVVNVAKSLTVWEKASPTSARMRKPQVVALKEALNVVQKIIIVSTATPFPWTSPTMQAMLNALNQPAGTLRTQALQTALDAISSADAEMHKAALKVVIDANPSVCYIHVKTFTATSTPSTTTTSTAGQPVLEDRKIRYTSAGFTANTQVYIIPPVTAAHELGFIQHCTAKSDRSAYSDGSGMEDFCTAAFPVGDAPTDASHHPWYVKGVGTNCTNPAWVALTVPSRTIDLQMNDNFINNMHFFHPKPAANVAFAATATLSSITRVQSFISYLVHKRPDGTFRLLRKVVYTINVAVGANAQGAVTSFTTTVQPITVTIPLANDTLPAVSAPSMNNRSEWRYKAPGTAVWTTTG